MNYYNENDPKAAAWLRELIKHGHIADGEVDERSIEDVAATDLGGFVQCHFFAGIGGWSYALRLAGWPDDRKVWTGSCPCQPFSSAGKRKVDHDERHLWPTFRELISKCRPAITFGEQVTSKDGKIWIAGVRTDLEALGFSVGAADLCAAGISAPMVSQRLHWVATSFSNGQPRPRISIRQRGQNQTEVNSRRNGSRVSLHNARLATADGYHEHWWSGALQVGWNCIQSEVERGGRKYSAQWRIKPGLSLLADGISGRVAQLCGFGNAIVPQLAAEFIIATEEALSAL
jgi:DNA (cytosine-5)-methyltransferase 1